MAQGHRTGLLPTAQQQFWINAILVSLAHRIAYTQASQGVDPRIAARHGQNQALAMMYWVVFIAPVMAIFTLGALSSFLGMLVVAPLNAIGTLILIRIHTASIRPADQRLVYAIPTWLLVVAGGVYITGFLSILFLGLLLP